MRLILVIFILFLSGCASSALETRAKDLAASKVAYDKATSCCTHFSEMKFVPLKEKGINKLIVGREFQAYDFEEGKSFFRAVVLPKLDYEYSLDIETWQTDSAGFARSLLSIHYFEPTLLFLDEKFNVIKKLTDLNLNRATWFTTSGWETDIPMNGDLANSRYLIVYTDPSVVGSSNVAVPSDFTTMAGNTFISIPIDNPNIPANYEGIINIEVDKI